MRGLSRAGRPGESRDPSRRAAALGGEVVQRRGIDGEEGQGGVVHLEQHAVHAGQDADDAGGSGRRRVRHVAAAHRLAGQGAGLAGGWNPERRALRHARSRRIRAAAAAGARQSTQRGRATTGADRPAFPREEHTMSESSSESSGPIITRRALLTGAVIGAGSIVLDGLPLASAQTVAPTPTTPLVPADPTAAPGGPTTAVSVRSPFEAPARTPLGVITGAS